MLLPLLQKLFILPAVKINEVLIINFIIFITKKSFSVAKIEKEILKNILYRRKRMFYPCANTFSGIASPAFRLGRNRKLKNKSRLINFGLLIMIKGE